MKQLWIFQSNYKITIVFEPSVIPKHVGATNIINKFVYLLGFHAYFYWEFYFLKGSLRDVFISRSALKGLSTKSVYIYTYI
jgi:hypothetical protein